MKLSQQKFALRSEVSPDDCGFIIIYFSFVYINIDNVFCGSSIAYESSYRSSRIYQYWKKYFTLCKNNTHILTKYFKKYNMYYIFLSLKIVDWSYFDLLLQIGVHKGTI